MFAAAILLFAAPAADPPPFEASPVAPLLYAGDFAAAEAALAARLAGDPGDDDARFALGAARALAGVERFGQFLYATGTARRWAPVRLLGVAPPEFSPTPRPVTYEQWRNARVRLLADLAAVDAVLAEIDGPAELRLDLSALSFDLNGDDPGGRVAAIDLLPGGRPSGSRKVNGRDVPFPAPFSSVRRPVRFDHADVAWLRGYCDLISAVLETSLAYDASGWWRHCAHLVFADPEGVPPYLRTAVPGRWSAGEVSDWVASVHHVSFPVRDADRLRKARRHLLAAVGHSRTMWDRIEAETDDDREWVPNPRQSSVTGLTVTAEQIVGFRAFLDQAEMLLNGKALAPFWRDFPVGEPTRGVNLKRVFEEPARFDLVEWIQGPGAEPFLEEGPISPTARWRDVRRRLGRNWLLFGVWVN